MSTKLNYAGFWLRFVAFIIDFIVTAFASAIVGLVFRDLGSILTIGIGAGYFIYFESSEYQGTLGKIALGLKVTDLKGARITPATAAIRHIGKFVSAIIVGIGFIMIAFTEKKQGLHDILAGTLVVLKTQSEKSEDKEEKIVEVKTEELKIVTEDKQKEEPVKEPETVEAK